MQSWISLDFKLLVVISAGAIRVGFEDVSSKISDTICRVSATDVGSGSGDSHLEGERGGVGISSNFFQMSKFGTVALYVPDSE